MYNRFNHYTTRTPPIQKKRTSRKVNIAIPADHREKIKEDEKRDKYLYVARELIKL